MMLITIIVFNEDSVAFFVRLRVKTSEQDATIENSEFCTVSGGSIIQITSFEITAGCASVLYQALVTAPRVNI